MIASGVCDRCGEVIYFQSGQHSTMYCSDICFAEAMKVFRKKQNNAKMLELLLGFIMKPQNEPNERRPDEELTEPHLTERITE